MSSRKANRKRPIHFHFWTTEEEAELIHNRMSSIGISNISAYVRKMAIDGYHVNIDLSDVKELVSLLRRCSNNLNQIARRANETRNIHAADIEDLRCRYDTLWNVADKILKGLAKIK